MTPLANGRALLPAPPSVGFGSTRAIGPSRHRKGKPGAGAWRRQRMLAVVSPTSARSPNIAPGSPDHSSSRIVSGCSMRGTNGDRRQPVQRQRAVAPSDQGDRGALIVATSPRSNHHRQSQARDDAQQVWVWRRSVRRLIDFRRLSLGVRMTQRCGARSCCGGSGNGYSPVYEAAARHRTFRGNEHATMTHPFSKGRLITRAPPPRPYT
jgi:hypothetical protein